jgi:fibronectin-binding autotransporter adhesin
MKKLIHISRVVTLVPSLGMSILLSGFLAPQLAQAADGTWNGTNGAIWNTSSTNWTGVSGTPWDLSNGLTNTAIFSSGANATVSGGINIYVNKIVFSANTSLLYTSPPEAVITLAGANATIDAAAGTSSTIKTVLAGTNGLIKTGSGTVTLEPGDGFWQNTFSGDITINGGNLVSIRSASLGDGAGAININSGGILNVDWNTVTRTGLVTVNGGTLRTQGGSPQLINNGAGFVFQNGAAITTSLGGSGGLTVNGARSFLYSANTYTGATVINAGGDLALLFGGALPTNTALTLSGTLLANNKSHTVGGLTGASTGLLYGDTAYTFTVNKVSGTDSYGGTIQNIGTFIKDGAGTLSLTNANNNTLFPSALTVNNGVLELGGAGRFNAGSYSGAISLSSASSALGIATSTNQTLSGTISGSGSLTKSSTGTLTLSGSNSYSGGTMVSGGTLTASHANALGGAAGAVTVNTNGVLNVNANMTRTGTVTVNGGELGSGNGSTLTINGGGFVLTGSSAAAAVGLAGSSGLTVSSPDARLWVQATYTGDTVINSGQLNIAGSGGIPTNSAVSIASGATVNLTSFFAATNINRTIGGLTGAGILYGIGGTVTVNKTSGSDTFSGDIQGGQGLIKAGAGTLVLAASSTYTGGTLVSGGTLQFTNGGSVAGNITNNAAFAINRTDSSTLTNTVSGSGALTKSGTGTLTLAGANSYNGVTTVSAGVLRVSSSGALGSTNGGTIVANGAQLRFFNGAGNWFYGDGETLNISGNAGASGGAIRSGGAAGETNTFQGQVILDANAQIQNNGSVLIFDVSSGDGVDLKGFNLVATNSGTTEFRDAIVSTGGGGSLTKAGSGTTILLAGNSYSGATDILAGRLTLSGNGRLGSGAITISNANIGTLELAVTGTNVMANDISGAGALLSSAGETRFTGAVTTTGALTVSGSTVRIGNGGTSGSFSGNTTLSNNTAQLVFDRSNAYAHSGTISGSGSVTKSGAGTTTLTGNNSFSGALAVNAGVLELNASTGAAAASASTILVATNATLLVSKTDQVNNSAAVTLSGGTIQRASGVSEVFGSLNMTASSFLDFSGGTAGTITFSGITYTPSALLALDIANFNQGSVLVFQTTNNLSMTGFTFSGSGGFGSSSFNGSTFTITAIPEPSTYLAAAGLLALFALSCRRRARSVSR